MARWGSIQPNRLIDFVRHRLNGGKVETFTPGTPTTATKVRQLRNPRAVKSKRRPVNQCKCESCRVCVWFRARDLGERKRLQRLNQRMVTRIESQLAQARLDRLAGRLPVRDPSNDLSLSSTRPW